MTNWKEVVCGFSPMTVISGSQICTTRDRIAAECFFRPAWSRANHFLLVEADDRFFRKGWLKARVE
jgi:hypothetical protein